jgi:antitoxin component YwqK of YwqJK toxin-antitoxin module
MSKKSSKTKRPKKSKDQITYQNYSVQNNFEKFVINDQPFCGYIERKSSTGKLMYQITVQEGLPNGDYKSFHQNGILHSHGKYINGFQTGVWNYYFLDGTMSIEGNYQNGVKLGNFYVFHKNGVLDFECTFQNDEIVGYYSKYHTNGVLKEVGYKVKNVDLVHCLEFDDKGELTDFGSFSNDQKIEGWSEKSFDQSTKSESDIQTDFDNSTIGIV